MLVQSVRSVRSMGTACLIGLILSMLRGQQDPQLRARADLQATDEARTTQSVLLMPLLRAKLGERVRSLREGARHQGSLKSGPLPFRASRN